MNKFRSFIKYCLFVLPALVLMGCGSNLPEGAVAPKLTIESLTLNNQGQEPKFIIHYTLEHRSAAPLPAVALDADVFIRDQKVATLHKQLDKGTMLNPNEVLNFELDVPVNLVGAASLDSMTNNSLLMLQGSCAVTVTITEDENLNNMNPSRSYQGLIKVEN